MPTWLTSLVLTVALAVPVLAQSELWRDRAMIPYKIGLDHMDAEDWEEAVRYFQQAIDADATFELAHYMLGRAHLAQKTFPDAAAALMRARDLYRDGAVRRLASGHDAQLTLRDRIAETDELIRQLQSRPQTARTMEQLRQFG